MSSYGGIALRACCALLFAFSLNASADDAKKIEVADETFKCLTEMTPVRGFFVANLLGKLDDTLKVANSPSGGRYPPGSVVQLVPTEVMVKHQEGFLLRTSGSSSSSRSRQLPARSKFAA